MKRIFLTGFLVLLAIGCTQTAPNATPKASHSTSAPFTGEDSQRTFNQQTSTQTTATDQLYSSSSLGFRFAYPDDYVVDPSQDNQTTESEAEVVIEIWKRSDYDAIQAQAFAGGTEFPPNITIEVFSNPDRLPIAAWKGDLSRDDSAVIVAGQDGIAYSSTGLYEQDNVLFSSPDGQQVIRLSVGYIDATDPMRQVLQTIASSFAFEPDGNG